MQRLAAGISKAALQCVHEIDHISLLYVIRGDSDRHAFSLAVDDFAQRLLIAVYKLRGIEVSSLLVDDLFCYFKHAGIRLRQIDGANLFDVTNFLMRAKRRQHNLVLARLERADPFARTHHEATDGN